MGSEHDAGLAASRPSWTPARHAEFDRYIAACDYPGTLDEQAVDAALCGYLSALGVRRDVLRLRQGWLVQEHADLLRACRDILGRFRFRLSRDRWFGAPPGKRVPPNAVDDL